MLLDLLLAHLHFLHHLLRSSAGASWEGVWLLLGGVIGGLLWFFDDDVVIARVGRLGLGGLGGGCGLAGIGGEDKFTGSSCAAVADHEDVVARTFEQLGEDVAGGCWAEAAEDALVGCESVHLHAGGGGDGLENFFEAGVGRIDGEVGAIEMDLGGMGLGEYRPVWRRWVGRVDFSGGGGR